LPLHNGRVFGLFGQILILLSGIVITAICVTGFLIYAKKARARELKQSIAAPSGDAVTGALFGNAPRVNS